MEISKTLVDYTEVIHCKQALTAEECSSVAGQILNYKQNQTPTGFEKTLNIQGNASCWRGEPFQNNGFDPLTQELILDKISKSIEYFINSLPVSNEQKHQLNSQSRHIEMWANVNDPDSTNLIHLHSGCFLSGVIYLQSTDTGSIEFIPSNWLNRHTSSPWPFHGTYIFHPADGDILLFPSYLFHQVNRNNSAKYRINLAFNVSLTEEKV
jgi:hypothetical protein